VSEPLTCPVCRARVEQGPQCRRCRADLSLLFALAEQRGRTLAAASAHAARGEWYEALTLAEGAAALRGGGDVGCLLAVARLLRRDFPGAWQAYREASGGRQPPDRRTPSGA
jgi:hypothetical protein